MGEFRFDRFDTSVGAKYCLFGALPNETKDDYRKRLLLLWEKDPAARQHLAVFARYQRRRILRYEGPMADVARDVVLKLSY